MNSTLTINIIRFVALIILQILICNQLNFLGSLNPFVYVLFIILYPIGINRTNFIFISFLIGLFIDLFLDTGGVHAAATVCIAYARPLILKFSFGAAYEYQAIKINESEVSQRLIYFIIIILFHHIILFMLLYFNLNRISTIVYKILVVSIFTFIVTILLNTIFSKN